MLKVYVGDKYFNMKSGDRFNELLKEVSSKFEVAVGGGYDYLVYSDNPDFVHIEVTETKNNSGNYVEAREYLMEKLENPEKLWLKPEDFMQTHDNS